MTDKNVLLKHATARRVEPVTLPDGGKLFVRLMTVAEREWFTAYGFNKQGEALANWRTMLVLLTACTEAGDALFSHGDADQLDTIPPAIIEVVADAALNLNKRPDADTAEAAKNS
jgi:hypothetical protein